MSEVMVTFGIGVAAFAAIGFAIIWLICLFQDQGWAWALLFAVGFVVGAYGMGSAIQG